MPALRPTVRQNPSSRSSLHSGTKTVGLGPPPPVGLKRSFWHCNLASARALGAVRLCFRAVGKVSVYQPPRGGSIGRAGFRDSGFGEDRKRADPRSRATLFIAWLFRLPHKFATWRRPAGSALTGYLWNSSRAEWKPRSASKKSFSNLPSAIEAQPTLKRLIAWGID